MKRGGGRFGLTMYYVAVLRIVSEEEVDEEEKAVVRRIWNGYIAPAVLWHTRPTFDKRDPEAYPETHLYCDSDSDYLNVAGHHSGHDGRWTC